MGKRKLNGDVIFCGALIVIGISFFMYSLIKYGETTIKVRAFPMVASSILVVLGIMQLVILVKNSLKDAERNEALGDLKKVAGVFLWVASMPTASYFLGIRIGFPLFAVAFLKSKKVNWMVSLIFAAAIFLMIHFLFGKVLQIRLFNGLILGDRL